MVLHVIQVTQFNAEKDDPLLFPKLVGETVVRGWALENVDDGKFFYNKYIFFHSMSKGIRSDHQQLKIHFPYKESIRRIFQYSIDLSQRKGVTKRFFKELRPRTANMALTICLKMKMIENVFKSDYSANNSLLILCLWL